MVWNNNQQTLSASGKMSHLCVSRKTSLRFTTTVRFSSLHRPHSGNIENLNRHLKCISNHKLAIVLGKMCEDENTSIYLLHWTCMCSEPPPPPLCIITHI